MTTQDVQFDVDLTAGNVKKVMSDHSTGRVDVYMVRPNAIRLRPGFNEAREADPEYEMHIRELADSIKANGFYRHKPLTVFAAADGYLYPSDGHSRYKAVLLANEEGAGIEAIPVINEVKGTTEEDRLIGLITNNSGKRLPPYGEGLVCKRLIGCGLSEKEIARRLGFPVAKVSNLLSLVGAAKPIRDMVTSGKVAATTAIQVMREHGPDAVKVLKNGADQADAAGKSKVTPKLLKGATKEKSKATRQADSGTQAAVLTDDELVALYETCKAETDGADCDRALIVGYGRSVIEAIVGQG